MNLSRNENLGSDANIADLEEVGKHELSMR
jgi:hypothetical protein